MQISGKQAVAVGLAGYAAYEVSKCFTGGASYALVAKVALSLFGSAALVYTSQNPKVNVSAETLEKTKQSLKQILKADSTSKEVKEIFKAVEETYGFTAENLISPGRNEIELIMDTPLMWGISKQGNPYLCLLMNDSRIETNSIFVFSVEEDNLRAKNAKNFYGPNEEGDWHEFIPFSAITSGLLNVKFVKNLIFGKTVPQRVTLFDGNGVREIIWEKLSAVSKYRVSALPTKYKTLQIINEG